MVHLPPTAKSLAFKVQQLSVLPVVLCISLIGLGIAIVQLLDTQSLEHKRNALASRWLVSLTQQALENNNTDHIRASFEDMMEMPNMRGIYLIDHEGNYLLKQGQRPNPKIAQHLDDQPTSWGSEYYYFYSTPIIDKTSANNPIHKGWIVVSINHAGLGIRQYQGLSVILAGLLLGVAVLSLLAWRLTRSLEAPLHNVQRTLLDYSRAKFDSRTPLVGCIEMQNLALSVNELGEKLQFAADDVKQQVDQATSDLQETLDTVEIQSIELDIARKKAVQASRTKSEFLANTTHEIRTPINGILGFTSLLLKSPMTTQQREYLRTIAHSSQGLLTIINDILDFSRLEENRLTLDRGPFNLRVVIEETLQILSPAASEKQLFLASSSNPEVPLHLVGDALRIKQVLTNLISNAIKFSDDGNIIASTHLISRSDQNVSIKVCIEDTGIGIDPEQKEALFEAFKQADASDSRQRGGTGLGLAIAKGLVSKMGGEIGIESTPQMGTNAWFTLPLPTQKNVIENKNTDLIGKKAAIYIANSFIEKQVLEYFDLWGVDVVTCQSPEDLASQCLQNDSHTRQGEFDFMLLVPSLADDINRLNQVVSAAQYCPILISALPDSSFAYNEALHQSGADILFLPISHDHLYQVLRDELQPPRQAPRQALAPRLEQTDKVVLVVDDNPANLQLVSTFLSNLGAVVLEARSGFEALSQIDKHAIDLVFMDIQMPQMDGIEATRRIRQKETRGGRIPIIALTAHDLSGQKGKLLRAGFDDYTSKPVSEDQLAHLLSVWLKLVPAEPDTATVAEVIAPSDMPQSSIMDLQDALRLSNGKRDLARDMLTKLTEGLSQEAETISSLYQQQRWPALQEVVHRLYGGCCYCGVPELREASGKLDASLVKETHQSLDSELNHVLKAIQRLREWVDEHDLDIIFDTEDTTISH